MCFISIQHFLTIKKKNSNFVVLEEGAASLLTGGLWVNTDRM